MCTANEGFVYKVNTHTHTHTEYIVLLLFHGKKDYANVQYMNVTIIRTLPVTCIDVAETCTNVRTLRLTETCT